LEKIIGTSNRILEIDLTNKQVIEFKVTENDRKLYLGGKGLGLKLLYEKLKPGIDPLGSQNILAFMMGVLMGTGAPCSGRFAAITKSPLTGILVTSSCGGPFGMAYKTAGYDGLLIKGKANNPIILIIDHDAVKFENASQYWGMDTRQTQEKLELDKNDGALVIGPAGENMVLFANVCSGDRFLGRGGIGAVMGAKNLKAIVAKGGVYKIVPKNSGDFKKVQKKALKYINANLFTAELYRNYGTAANFNFCNHANILPVENFKYGSHRQVNEVSGESMQQKYQTIPSPCIPCTILCGHKSTLGNRDNHKIPEYETAALFGPNLGIFDTDAIIEYNDLCNRFGLDTISTGSTIAYLMEAGEKGLLKTDLKFGSKKGISEIIAAIAHRKGLGDELANGTRRLSEKYGGKDFTLQVKGMEFPAYDPRGSWGQGLSYAVANRGACHLSASTFSLETFLGFLNPYATRAKAHFVSFFENLFCTINSLYTCLFTAYAYVLEPFIVKYTPTLILKFTMQNFPGIAVNFINIRVLNRFFEAVTGIKMSQKKLLEAGERIHILERYMNTREGISRKDDTLPERFLKEGRKNDPLNRVVPLKQMLDQYYKIRGFDDNGIPTVETLRKLGIEI